MENTEWHFISLLFKENYQISTKNINLTVTCFDVFKHKIRDYIVSSSFKLLKEMKLKFLRQLEFHYKLK
jgi:hypothetical protein